MTLDEEQKAYQGAVEYLLICEENYEVQKQRMLRNHGADVSAGDLENTRRLVAAARALEKVTLCKLCDAVELERMDPLPLGLIGTDASEADDERRAD